MSRFVTFLPMLIPFIPKRIGISLFAASCLLATGAVHADIAVFVHGYQSSGDAWRKAGVFAPLARAGWTDAGGYRYQGRRVIGPNRRPQGKNLLLTVDLPNNAPVLYQAGYLRAALQSIRRFAPEESLTLVGHSAGGIVSRATLVLFPELKVARLVAIATPNLGARLADIGATLASSPVGLFARLMGERKLARSGKLLSDISPQSNHNFLGWLNSRAHPEADYIAVIHVEDNPAEGDGVIPGRSQDLRAVPALAGKATAWWVRGGHGLGRSDGDILAGLLLRPAPAHEPSR
ncbi:MAG TPA: alpha/beta fold hydrolase [Gammaproteobacteria bacterium]|nr:alpha/beta fold hydrolase [Gammaproteobacteria bacterium]